MVSKARHLASLAKALNTNSNGAVEMSGDMIPENAITQAKIAPGAVNFTEMADSAGYATGALDSAFGIMMDELINIAENR